MDRRGYQRRDIYDALQKWWTGEGSIEEVELKLDARNPFLRDYFFQTRVLDSRGSIEDGVTFQDAFNLLLLHLVLYNLRGKKE